MNEDIMEKAFYAFMDHILDAVDYIPFLDEDGEPVFTVYVKEESKNANH